MEKVIILLVEDDVALLEGMSDTLEMQGYKTIQATDGRKGLEVLQQVQPDLIISDIMMPEMDGYEFHRAVASSPESAGIPFIFLTAKSDQEDVRKGLREGVDAYLTKPFDLEELLIHVQNKLDRFAMIRQQALAQLDELQSQIVTMFSHELRTPLTYIQGYTDLLADTPQSISPDEMKLFLDGIQNGSRRLNQVIENLLTLVQIDTDVYGQEYAQFSRIERNLGRLVRSWVKGYERMAAEKGLAIDLSVADPLPPVRIVPDQISRALGALIGNAIRFTRTPDARIDVAAYQDQDLVFVDVIDRGCGISPGDLTHVFERFRQIDRDKHEQPGIGVGLAIAQGLVRVHGGDIDVESRLDEGSKFTIRLPVARDTDD